ncbi:MAG: hypothetical protein R8G66_01485 [Cytophagales bacterium]|nr:hypothetical protein [Cytophagales bacterium]
MQTIKFSDALTLEVTSADNQLTVFLDADVPGGALVYKAYDHYASGFAPSFTDKIDLTDAANQMLVAESSLKLTLVGSNYAGGGQLSFKVSGDSEFTVNENLATDTSKQWAVEIQKG